MIEHGDDSDSESDDEDGSEKAEVLSAVVETGKKDYKKNTECFKCGKLGHYARDYQSGDGDSNNKNGYGKGKGIDRGYGRNSGGGRGNGKFTDKCHKCGKTGQKKESCWSKTQSEIGAAAVDREIEGTIEYLMSHVEIEGEIFDKDDPRCCDIEDLFCTDNEEVDCQDVNMDDKKEIIDQSAAVLVTKLSNKNPEELCMKAMTVPNTVSLLNNPSIFIGDSGASTHSTQCGQGLVNNHKGKDNDSVMVGSDILMKASVVGNFSGTICNKYGEAIRK